MNRSNSSPAWTTELITLNFGSTAKSTMESFNYNDVTHKLNQLFRNLPCLNITLAIYSIFLTTSYGYPLPTQFFELFCLNNCQFCIGAVDPKDPGVVLSSDRFYMMTKISSHGLAEYLASHELIIYCTGILSGVKC